MCTCYVMIVSVCLAWSWLTAANQQVTRSPQQQPITAEPVWLARPCSTHTLLICLWCRHTPPVSAAHSMANNKTANIVNTNRSMPWCFSLAPLIYLNPAGESHELAHWSTVNVSVCNRLHSSPTCAMQCGLRGCLVPQQQQRQQQQKKVLLDPPLTSSSISWRAERQSARPSCCCSPGLVWHRETDHSLPLSSVKD